MAEFRRCGNSEGVAFRTDLVKPVFAHLAMLTLVCLAMLKLPTGGRLILSDSDIRLIAENPLGGTARQQTLTAADIDEAEVVASRMKPGEDPYSVGYRIELRTLQGKVYSLTRHYSRRVSDMRRIVRRVNQHLADPVGRVEVSYDDHSTALWLLGAIGLFAIYGIVWGSHQTKLHFDPSSMQLVLTRRRLLFSSSWSWPLGRIDHFALEMRNPDAEGSSKRRVRPVVVLRDATVKPIVSSYSALDERRYRNMLKTLEEVSGIPFQDNERP